MISSFEIENIHIKNDDLRTKLNTHWNEGRMMGDEAAVLSLLLLSMGWRGGFWGRWRSLVGSCVDYPWWDCVKSVSTCCLNTNCVMLREYLIGVSSEWTRGWNGRSMSSWDWRLHVKYPSTPHPSHWPWSRWRGWPLEPRITN